MKILFFMRSTIYVRNFESTLRMLAQRGHDVHIVAEPYFLAESGDLVDRLCGEHPNIRYSPIPAIPFNRWSFLGFELRRTLDYVRYLGPEFADARKLRLRAERNAPEVIVTALPKWLFESRLGRWLLMHVLRWCDRAIPRDEPVEAFIRAQHPDLVLVTPLVEPGSPQADYVRGARALGIRTGLCVYSWDNLTNKGLIHDPLDLVTVWNEPMREEAIAFHGMPRERVVVTGAVPYDHWFTWKARLSRDEFCARVGLSASRPYVLYLCSSKFIAPDEVPFVRRWVQELRSSSTLRHVGVLVRPHPQNAQLWQDADLSDMGDVAIWPRAGANPIDEHSRADYYDSIYHSAAVVGVNTSAQIESAIVGRAVYTVLDPEFRDTQEGTLHFHHLKSVNGGLLHVAANFAEHVAQLEAAVRNAGDDGGRCRRFVEAFVRPHGLDVAATPRLVAAIEATAALGPARQDRGPWWAFMMRPLLERIVVPVTQTGKARKERLARNERVRAEKRAEREVRRSEWSASKQNAHVERASRRQKDAERFEAERRASEALASKAYDNYVYVRERVRQMHLVESAVAATAAGSRSGGANGDAIALTPAEERMRAELACFWDASPDTIATLRQRCEPITGVRASDYQPSKSKHQGLLRREHRRLRRQVGPELFVEEPLTLGGFGYIVKDGRFNEDTLKFFNVLVALKDAAVLNEFRDTAERRLVWDIGGGWGGFAYQFKAICPNVTYLITGSPELLLVSGVYLKTVLPAARLRFFEESSVRDLWADWETVDFVFAPESAVPLLRPPRLDLTLDIITLQKMTPERVASHVERAFECGSRFFYSVVPASSAAGETPLPWKAIERRYWPHPVPPRREPEPLPAGVESLAEREIDYAHLVGWRRIRP